MKLPVGHVGTTVGPRVQEIDARWLMAYAASLGDTTPEYLDTTRPEGVISHPLFPVCYEWPLAVELRDAMPQAIAVRSVHATHDLRLHRRVRPGDRLSTTATVVSMEPRGPGAYVVTRFQTTDAVGRHVSTTDYGSIYRGVECERAGLPSGPEESRPVSTSAPAQEGSPAQPRVVGRRRRTGRTRPHLHRMRTDLESHPHRQGRGALRRATGHHPARHGNAGPGRLRSARARDGRRRCERDTYSLSLHGNGAPALDRDGCGMGRAAARGAPSDRVSGPRCRWPSRAPKRTARRGRAPSMTKFERVQATLKREATDRPPYAFWRHFPGGGPLGRGARAVDAPIPRALRLRLPQGHAIRRLRDRGLGMRGERRGGARWPPPLRAPRRDEPRRLEEDPPAPRRVDRLGGAPRDGPPLHRGPARRLLDPADDLQSALAGAKAVR